MRTATTFAVVGLLLVGALVIGGCGKKADPNKPLEEIKAEAAKMDAGQLQAMVDAYEKALKSKEGEMKALADKIKEIPVTEMMGDDAKKLKADAAKLAESAKALGARLEVYDKALKDKAAK